MRDPSVADTCNVCGAVPLVGLAESQEESLTAVKVSVPPPVFVTFTDVAAGFVLLPCVALNESVVVESDKTGGGAPGAATLKVTVTVAGESCTPVAETVIWPV